MHDVDDNLLDDGQGCRHEHIVIKKTDDKGTYVRVVPECSMHSWEPWPTKCDILCWNCCHPFTTPPVPLPVSYDERRDSFHVMGNFCSWACAKAYSRDYVMSGASRGSQAMALTLLRKRATRDSSPLVAAPPRILLKAFGGYMSIDEYRTSHHTSAWSTTPPRLITYAQVIHDRKVGEHQRKIAACTVDLSSQIDLGNTQTTSLQVESLKLKRPKPVKKTSNMLEIALGLVSK